MTCGHPGCRAEWQLAKRDVPLAVKTKATQWYCCHHPYEMARIGCKVSSSDIVRASPPCHRSFHCSRKLQHSGK